MSEVEKSSAFLEPLIGKTTTFMLAGRQDNLAFARTIAGLLDASGRAAAVLDLDAFYSSHADLVLVPVSARADSWTLRVPLPGSDIEDDVSQFIIAPQDTLILDSLNTLYHLFTLQGDSSRGRRLGFALAGLSYLARTNFKAVILSMYRREGSGRPGTARSISGLSDIAASVEVEGNELSMRTERGSAWPGGVFSIRIP
ncbi:MAG: hypothetical protein JRN12_02420 [Nitrososphaerota archaeon]|jgi:hypothetical protein|nr:hypothetical protein [Nitrososphaerota archaeon]MDG6942969.1 hypothetical protein [Nitrososphaerota archaeon]MDG6950697.1 hypothetical protein [Nitrososphaerota archaeon]